MVLIDFRGGPAQCGGHQGAQRGGQTPQQQGAAARLQLVSALAGFSQAGARRSCIKLQTAAFGTQQALEAVFAQHFTHGGQALAVDAGAQRIGQPPCANEGSQALAFAFAGGGPGGAGVNRAPARARARQQAGSRQALAPPPRHAGKKGRLDGVFGGFSKRVGHGSRRRPKGVWEQWAKPGKQREVQARKKAFLLF